MNNLSSRSRDSLLSGQAAEFKLVKRRDEGIMLTGYTCGALTLLAEEVNERLITKRSIKIKNLNMNFIHLFQNEYSLEQHF